MLPAAPLDWPTLSFRLLAAHGPGPAATSCAAGLDEAFEELPGVGEDCADWPLPTRAVLTCCGEPALCATRPQPESTNTAVSAALVAAIAPPSLAPEPDLITRRHLPGSPMADGQGRRSIT